MRRAKWSVGAIVLIAVAATAGAMLLVLKSSLREIETEGAVIGASPGSVDADGSTSGISLESAPVSEEGPDARTTPRELPDGVWIRGRVVVPAGTPSDEKVEIAARVLSFDDAPGYVAAMGSDGSFAVMFPRDVDSGWIEIHARYLVLEPNHAVDLEEPPGEVVLEPVLGGRVRGRIVAPGRSEGGIHALAGTRVELSANTDPASQRFYARRTSVGEDLRFEFLALPPSSEYDLAVKAKDFLPFEEGFEIPPGRSTEVEIELRAGARVSGRVVDADGKPVEGANVWTTEVWHKDAPRPIDAKTVSGPDGVFAITAIPPSDVTIAVKADGHLPEIVEIGRLQDGDVRAGIEIRLRPGIIHGRVEWPDGSPAIDAVVETVTTVIFHGGSISPNPERQRADVQDGGRFEIEVGTDRPHSLFAQSPRKPQVDPGDASATSESGVATVEGILPGSAPVVIVLEPSPIVRGRVTDDLGKPVTNFDVIGRRQFDPRSDEFGRSVQGKFEHPAGAFAFAGIAPGSWRFVATDHEKMGRESVVELPNGGAPIVLVVPRGASVSGIIVGPEGQPVSGAMVHTMLGKPSVSGEEGLFEVKAVRAGSTILWAEASSFAPSEPVRLQAEVGGSVVGVRLVLRRGGTIVCEVLDGDGHPETRRGILIQSSGGGRLGGSMSTRMSDEEGRVVIEDLPPGAYSLSRMPTPEELESEEEPAPSPWTRFASSRTEASVDVVAGEAAHVRIGGPPGAPVRVRGRVTDAELPVVGIDVVSRTVGRVDESRNRGRTEVDGRFEFLVREPCDLELSLLLRRDRVALSTLRRVVADPIEDLTLALPRRGTISGIVRSTDGRPVDGARLLISSDEGVPSIGMWTASGSSVSDGGGHFSFQGLPAGRYVVSTFVEPPTGNEWSGISVTLPEGGHLDDVVIRLP